MKIKFILLTSVTFLAVLLFSRFVYSQEAATQPIEKSVFKLKSVTVKIALPDGWKKADIPQGDAEGAENNLLFVRDNPKAAFSLQVSDLGADAAYSSKGFQMKFFDETKANVRKQMGDGGYKWVSEDIGEILNVPLLYMIYEKDKLVRENVFIKQNKLFIINFICPKEDFVREWAGVDRSIKDMGLEFAK